MMNSAKRVLLRSFGFSASDEDISSLGAGMGVVAVIFVVLALPLLAVVNLVTLMFGVTVNFLGRDGVKFRFLRLFGRVKAIYVMLPVLILYAIWHKVQTAGIVTPLLPIFLTAAAALVLLAISALAGRRAVRR